MVSGGTSRGRKRRAFRWFERKPRIPARYPFQRTMIRHCLCAIRNVERERERERESESVADYWQGASLRMKSYTARGWKEKGEWDESLDGGLLSITRAPRDESLATRWPLSLSLFLCEFVPLWNTSRNSSAIRPKFWNFNSTRGGKGREEVENRWISVLPATRSCPWKWSFAPWYVAMTFE